MTPSAVVFAFAFIFAGIVVVVAAYATLGAAVLPRLTRRARSLFQKRAWLPLAVGVAVSLPWAGVAILLLNLPNSAAQFVGAALAGLWMLFGLLGAAGPVQAIGMYGREDREPTWQSTFAGGLVLGLTWILPLVGWLVVLPMSLAAGIGSLVLCPFIKDPADGNRSGPHAHPAQHHPSHPPHPSHPSHPSHPPHPGTAPPPAPATPGAQPGAQPGSQPGPGGQADPASQPAPAMA